MAVGIKQSTERYLKFDRVDNLYFYACFIAKHANFLHNDSGRSSNLLILSNTSRIFLSRDRKCKVMIFNCLCNYYVITIFLFKMGRESLGWSNYEMHFRIQNGGRVTVTRRVLQFYYSCFVAKRSDWSEGWILCNVM